MISCYGRHRKVINYLSERETKGFSGWGGAVTSLPFPWTGERAGLPVLS